MIEENEGMTKQIEIYQLEANKQIYKAENQIRHIDELQEKLTKADVRESLP